MSPARATSALRLLAVFLLLPIAALQAQQIRPFDYRVVATNRTGTMQKEMNEAADAGFRFKLVMGGETGIGGKEVVAVLERAADAAPRYEYRLLATNRTATMQKELQEAADAGFEYRGQTVFDSTFGGREVACILEKDLQQTTPIRYDYKLLATTRTSTMQKEMQEVAEQGYEVLGLTIGKTAMGGSELVTIVRKRL
jgi:hypothetical protein